MKRFLIFILANCFFAKVLLAQFTTFNPSSDTEILYVSDSDGNDASAQIYAPNHSSIGANPFLPIGSVQAFKTISAALSQATTNQKPYWILLKRGDVFTNQNFMSLGVSGRSMSEPFLIASYGSNPNRPLIETGNNPIFYATQEVSHIAWLSLSFIPHTRIPSDECVGLNITDRESKSFLIEDCVFDSYSSHLVIQDYAPGVNYRIRNFIARRNQFLNAYITSGNGSGAYFYKVENIEFDENLFDHNGWHPSIIGAAANGFRHSTYFYPNCKNLVFKNNIVTRSSGNAIGARCGGIIYNNLLIRNPTSIMVGSHDGSQINFPSVSVKADVEFNVILDGKKESYDQGMGIVIQRNRNSKISRNIVAHYSDLGNYNAGIVGDNLDSIQIHRNIVYNWGNNNNGSIDYASALQFGSTLLGSIKVDSNHFQIQNPNAYCINLPIPVPSLFSLSNNIYYNFGNINNWFPGLSYADWQTNSYETNPTQLEINYLNPNRNVFTFLSTQGISGSLEEFIEKLKEQSSMNWNTNFTAKNFNHYIREGFNMQGSPYVQTEEYTPMTTLEIYPNPCSDYLHIKGLSSLKKYRIISITGQIVSEGYHQNIVPVKSLKSGVYILQIEQQQLKFIKE